MKHLQLFKLFEQSTSTRQMPEPFEKGLLAIYNERKEQVSKMNLGDFLIIKGLNDTTSIAKEFTGTPPQEPMLSLRKKNIKEYKSNLFKCLAILVGSFGDKENNPIKVGSFGDKENNPIKDYKSLLPLFHVWIPNMGEGTLQTMITQCSEKLSTLDKSQGPNLLRLFKKGYGIGG